eukprot:366531-Chlamydomonas_euryale.AAC.4
MADSKRCDHTCGVWEHGWNGTEAQKCGLEVFMTYSCGIRNGRPWKVWPHVWQHVWLYTRSQVWCVEHRVKQGRMRTARLRGVSWRGIQRTHGERQGMNEQV